ncbi:MAG: pro-sigmaK processing inhibitor BofA family protein [Lachnospiraceae bacterium]|nr:pro-sigmaK processing inhibitor BofA family protein [Lachnospiraceae bacterium]MCD8250112.1 pro-sigmaK processing inhibitor BofA family protein [Lachnospiraceae bacterium]
MDKTSGVFVIAGACLLVLFMVTVKHKAEILLNFCLRAVLGEIAIHVVNTALSLWGISCSVGIGPLSLLTSGILGISGVSLLYAIAAIRFL